VTACGVCFELVVICNCRAPKGISSAASRQRSPTRWGRL
jgi:hypothetical protein